MKKQLSWLFGAALWALRSASSAIDFTPRLSDTYIDGVVHRRVFFMDGGQKVGVAIDDETKVEEENGAAVFRFLKIPSARFVIRNSPMSADQPFDGVSMERYREAAHRLLPPLAGNVKVLAEFPDVIPLGKCRSYQFLIACDALGAVLVHGITFLNLNDGQQLVLMTIADRDHYKDASDKALLLMRTWRLLPPYVEKPAVGK